MGALRIEEMRLSGIGLVILSLGCLSALDESIEAGHDFNEVTKIPQTEVAEVVLPQTNLKEREERQGLSNFQDQEGGMGQSKGGTQSQAREEKKSGEKRKRDKTEGARKGEEGKGTCQQGKGRGGDQRT